MIEFLLFLIVVMLAVICVVLLYFVSAFKMVIGLLRMINRVVQDFMLVRRYF